MAGTLTTGDIAPDFSLPDQNGETTTLQSFRGQWVVLYFYPKDNTPGCTQQACNLRDDTPQIKDLGAQVIGISVDDRDSHQRFSQQHNLPFPLLSDTQGNTSKAYGALFSIGPLRFSKRHTFIIDPKGHIAALFRKVKPASHSDKIIAALKSLQNN